MAEPASSISVDPPVVLAAARAEWSAAAELRAAAPSRLDVAAAGDPESIDALMLATGALTVVAQVCADGLDVLGAALEKAYYAYRAADAVAVPG